MRRTLYIILIPIIVKLPLLASPQTGSFLTSGDAPFGLSRAFTVEIESEDDFEDLKDELIELLGKPRKMRKKDRIPGQMVFVQEFTCYRKWLVGGKPIGGVRYLITIQRDGNELTYSFSQFQYLPLKKDRYNVYQPVNGREKPLEMAEATLKEKDWMEVASKTKTVTNNRDQQIAEILGQQVPEEMVTSGAQFKLF